MSLFGRNFFKVFYQRVHVICQSESRLVSHFFWNHYYWSTHRHIKNYGWKYIWLDYTTEMVINMLFTSEILMFVLYILKSACYISVSGGERVLNVFNQGLVYCYYCKYLVFKVMISKVYDRCQLMYTFFQIEIFLCCSC